MVKEFRDFLMRGNLVELAVAFVIGLAFFELVNTFIGTLVLPIVALIFGEPDFGSLRFTINSTEFLYGSFLTSAIGFLTTAAVVFFFVVKPMNAMMARVRPPTEDLVPDEERRHWELLAAIREIGR